MFLVLKMCGCGWGGDALIGTFVVAVTLKVNLKQDAGVFLNDVRFLLNFMKIGQLVSKLEGTRVNTHSTANWETFLPLNEGK